MHYAFVHDIAASWRDYERIAAPTIEPAPVGLILHLAGPTDEGIRIIEVWESKRAWECSLGDHFGPAIAALGGPRLPAARFRDLQPRRLVLPTLGPDTEPMTDSVSNSTGPRPDPTTAGATSPSSEGGGLAHDTQGRAAAVAIPDPDNHPERK